jgi:hypothetical protein
MLKRAIHRWERKLSTRDTNRRVRPFEWGLEFLDGFPGESGDPANGTCNGGQLSQAENRQLIFDFNERAIAGSEVFFGTNPVSDFTFDGHWLAFQSPVSTPYGKNNTAYARYFPVAADKARQNGGASTEAARAGGRAVLVLPQWNADVDGHVAVCKLLGKIGIASLRLSLPYHDRRMLEGFERADYLVSSNIGRTLQACRQAVADSRAAIDWLARRGYDRIGIAGTSIGSCIAFLAMVHDHRLRVGVFNHVSSFFGDVVWDGITTSHVRQGLETALTREEVRRSWSAISPNSYVGKLTGDRRRRLMISARYDLTFTPELSQLLFDECDRRQVFFDRSIVPCGHYTLGEPPFKYYAGYLIANYFRKHL